MSVHRKLVVSAKSNTRLLSSVTKAL